MNDLITWNVGDGQLDCLEILECSWWWPDCLLGM